MVDEMILGAWFHNDDGKLDVKHLQAASEKGLTSIRSYNYSYVAELASLLRELSMSVYAGIYVEAEDILRNPRSQVKKEVVARYFELGIPMTALCIGNELRDPWTEVGQWTLSAKLVTNLAFVISELKDWLIAQGYNVPLTYAMEAPFPWKEWMTPVIEACDIISINHYPIKSRHWFGEGGFEANRKFLTDTRETTLLLLDYELTLRQVMEQVTAMGKELILSETGLPSGIAFARQHGTVIPKHEPTRFAEGYRQLLSIIYRVNADYNGHIKSVYFYEWRDNLYHRKIESEDSPIHTCFGLCYSDGTPKFDISILTENNSLKRNA